MIFAFHPELSFYHYVQMKQRSKFYVTTPIYYVNDRPHIGHAYTTILADVLARYHRLLGVPTHFLTGTDEHGQKVQRSAEEAGVSPREQAEATVVRFQDLWRKLEITNDDFIRTTESRHEKTVGKILRDLYEKDEIYKAEYDGWYCVTCERFYTERDARNGVCPEEGCGRPLEKIKESNYFFRMSKYRDWLIGYIENNPGFIQPDFRRNETLGFLKKELNDLCISRPKSRMSWGIELPFDSDFVTYVWFDALVNYISAVGYPEDDSRFSKWWPASCHLIGKDILTTHTVYWPTMLKAMGLPLPECIFAHGWWLAGADKMSKSAGNVVNPMEFVDLCGVDAFRYFLMAEMTLGQDASFTEEGFALRYNAELANNLGNLLSRVMKLIHRHCAGKIPEPAGTDENTEALKEAVLSAAERMAESVGEMRIDLGIAAVAEGVREANRYMEKTQPWNMARQGKAAELGTVLWTSAEALRILSGLLYPVMPGKTTALLKALGCGDAKPEYESLNAWGGLRPGAGIGEMMNLFPRVRVKNKPDTPKSTDSGKEKVMTIDYDDFQKVQLKTAKVVEAWKVERADKLLQLEVEVGEEKRQIVAGIAQHYSPEELVGRTIVVVANLKPATIRGVESQGMLLAADEGDTLRLVTVDGEGALSGAVVK
ncbi:MAG: methionine--tRNA ligase [Kiritimatiellia bacterium]